MTWLFSLGSTAVGWVIRLFTGGRSGIAKAVAGIGGGRGLLFGFIAAAVVGAGIYVWKLNDTIDDLRGEVATATADTRVAVEANRELTGALEEARQQFQRATEALEAERAEFEKRVRALDQIREEIANAPRSDDGPVAPVLGRTLDRLRELSGAESGDEAGGAAPAGSEGSADLPAGADGSEG